MYFTKTRLKYSNRAVTYCDNSRQEMLMYSLCTLIKQLNLKCSLDLNSIFQHSNLDFSAMLKSIAGLFQSLIIIVTGPGKTSLIANDNTFQEHKAIRINIKFHIEN